MVAVEVDPADAVGSMIVPEAVTKCNAGSSITAEHIHGQTCATDQKQVVSLNDASDGSGFQLTTSSTSTNKLNQMFQVFAVTDHFADSVALVHPTVALKFRQHFHTTTRRVERRFNADVPMVVAHWNKHVAAWLRGLRAGVNPPSQWNARR